MLFNSEKCLCTFKRQSKYFTLFFNIFFIFIFIFYIYFYFYYFRLYIFIILLLIIDLFYIFLIFFRQFIDYNHSNISTLKTNELIFAFPSEDIKISKLVPLMFELSLTVLFCPIILTIFSSKSDFKVNVQS